MADRGNYLLGPMAAYAYFTATFCVCHLWYRIAAVRSMKNKAPKIAFLSVVTVAVAAVLSQPTLLHDNVQYGLSDTRAEREFSQHFYNFCASAPSYSNLSVKFTRMRMTTATISGTVKEELDLRKLRGALQDSPPSFIRLSWRVQVDEDGKTPMIQ